MRISFIIPLYNMRKHFRVELDAIRNTDVLEAEFILVDDGSTDDTLELCRELQLKDDRVKYISIDHSGVSVARNYGLELATGELVSFLDADDYVDEHIMELISDSIRRYPNADLYNYGFYSELNNYMDIISYEECYLDNKDRISQRFIDMWDSSVLYNVWNKVFRKSIIDKYSICFKQLAIAEDIEFNSRYLLHINSLYNSSKAYYHYLRERNESLSNKYKEQLFLYRCREYNIFNQYYDMWHIPIQEYIEYTSRRFIERVLGCIENNACGNLSFIERYRRNKKIINNKNTKIALRYAKPNSMMISIMLLPLKIKSPLCTTIMGDSLHRMKVLIPGRFNRLKNRR